MADVQARATGDPETERKLRKQVRKYKALYEDAQEELEHERESRNNAAAIRSLRSQLEELELRESAAVKTQKRLKSDMDEIQAQCDELTRVKMEVGRQTTMLSGHHYSLFKILLCVVGLSSERADERKE